MHYKSRNKKARKALRNRSDDGYRRFNAHRESVKDFKTQAREAGFTA